MIDAPLRFCYEPGPSTAVTLPTEPFMANSKSKHRRVRSKIRLKWKKRADRKKVAAKAAAAGAKKKK